MSESARSHLDEHIDALTEALSALRSQAGALEAAAQRLTATFAGGGRALIAGNGGSAAGAQHLAAELVGRLTGDYEREPLPAVALTADSAIVTALANDYGYGQVFVRQVQALGRRGDAFVVLSTSGRSANLVEGVATAKAAGLTTLGILGGEGSPLHEACDAVVTVPANSSQRIQECQLVLAHVLVALIEEGLCSASRA